MGIQSQKNFININAANAIIGVPKKPVPVCVDRYQGDKFLLETSGLVPRYLKKKVCLQMVVEIVALRKIFVLRHEQNHLNFLT